MFVTDQPHAHVRFRRAIERRALWLAEDAAREVPHLPLEDALQLVHLYFERGSPKAELAARRWLVRYLTEGTPSLQDVAKVTASLASTGSGGRNTKLEVVQLAGVPIRDEDVLVLVDLLHTAEMHRTAEALEVARVRAGNRRALRCESRADPLGARRPTNRRPRRAPR